MPAHILLADDDAISRDILRLVLTSRNYAVTVADNGWVAVEKLRDEVFDVAILDYHMPVLDGVSVARKAREITGTGARPRFIGVTADPAGLEDRDHAHDMFDAIVQKPINLPALLEVIETSLRIRRDKTAVDRILDLWGTRGFQRRPRVRFGATPATLTRLELDPIFDLARPENPDVILLTDGASPQDVGDLRTGGNLFTLPAVDMTGRMGSVADAVFRPADLSSWTDVAASAKAFASRRTQLTQRFLNAGDLSDQLLAYIYVSGRDLRPVIDLSQDYGICYPGMFPTSKVLAAAERLAQQGLLNRSRAMRDARTDDPKTILGSAPRFELSDAAIEKLTGAPRFELTPTGTL